MGMQAERGGGTPAASRPTIALASDSAAEVEAAARLTELFERYSLEKFTYTKRVLIDEGAPRSSSHPVLTLLPAHLSAEPERALSVYLHEQLHWALNEFENAHAAIEEACRRWPQPPGPDAGGALDPESTWLHIPVCSMEYVALSEFLGGEDAATVLRAHPWYRWIYEQILADLVHTRGYLKRHGLILPPAPPNVLPPGQVLSLSADGPHATLVTGRARELAMFERLADLHDRYNLGPWCLSKEFQIDATAVPDYSVPRLGVTRKDKEDADVLLAYLEMQSGWWTYTLDDLEPVEGILFPVLAVAGLAEVSLPRELMIRVTLWSLVATSGLVELAGIEESASAETRHPLNADVYAALRPRREELVTALRETGVPLPGSSR